jgi:hypothetical protein
MEPNSQYSKELFLVGDHRKMCKISFYEFVDQISDENQFPCPLCKNDTNIPNGGVTSFKSNIYVKAMQASQLMEETKSTCETCEEAPNAETYCRFHQKFGQQIH